MSNPLTTIESAKLENYEAIVVGSEASFIDVGTALDAIRSERLYRESAKTFERYCDQRFGFVASRARQLISAVRTVEKIKSVTNVTPEYEGQLRALYAVPLERRAELWLLAVEADGKEVCPKTIAKIVAEELRPKEIIHSEPLAGVVSCLRELDGHRFGTIYADPPWAYGNTATRANVKGLYAGTMSVEDICAMPVDDLAADDSHLHLWTTNGFLREAFSVMDAWGFEYKSCAVWCKPQIGIGNYWRVSHEFLLLGIKGDAKRFNEHGHRSWQEIDRTKEHSTKPDEFRGIIEKVSPGPFLELFGRKPIEGWMVFGNQVEQRLFSA